MHPQSTFIRHLPLLRWIVCAGLLCLAGPGHAAAAGASSAPSAEEPAAASPNADTTILDRVQVIGTRPSTLPIEIPTTTHSITGAEIEQTINATDAEDALKYFPSLNVRKRYIGDYDHAVLASRASGTGSSARSLVYADGILLSNLLGNGATYTPRWGLVTPEEIDRVDVMYGPFSAAYSGNSAGAVVDFTTRMPQRFEAHAKLQGFTQHFSQYGTDDRFSGGAGSMSLGNRVGDWSWWLNVNRLDSTGQPIAFVNRLVSAGVAGQQGIPVSGAVLGSNPAGQPWLIMGDTNRIHTVQDHAKLKLAYDYSPTLRLSYTLGYWKNNADRSVSTYLHDASGNPVYGGGSNPKVNIGGSDYTLLASDFAPSTGNLEHVMHGLTLKSNTRGTWDWEAAASLYDESRDLVRTPTVFLPAAAHGGAGRITDMQGTGWNTLSLKGIWRPEGIDGAHIVEAGLQRDAFKLRTLVSNTSDWLSGGPGTRYSAFNGNTALASVWAQDAWRFASDWKAVLGARVEHWTADDGSIADATNVPPRSFVARSENHVSPKAALSWAPGDDWTFKGSLGRAVRMPTVAELYQGSIVSGQIVNNDPNLKPERSWTGELTAERAFGASPDAGRNDLDGLLRATYFDESTADALYSQTNYSVTPTVTNIQNVDRIHTNGLELFAEAHNLGLARLDGSASLTFADSIITANANFPASVGHWQPRVPRWRATLQASYAPVDDWTVSTGVRYSGRQYGTLDNSDPNGATYTGVSRYLVADLRLQYRAAKQWTVSAGIDNLGNTTYWAFHPYTQRTYDLELRWDL